MPNIFIPPLGSIIELEKDWCFHLHDEARNNKLQLAINSFPPYRNRDPHLPMWRQVSMADRKAEVDASEWEYEPHSDMPADADYNYWSGTWTRAMVFREGTRLKFDRIYLRRGQKDFDSVTFTTNCWMSSPGDPLFTASRKLKSLRFWAKLDDVNQIVGKFVQDR